MFINIFDYLYKYIIYIDINKYSGKSNISMSFVNSMFPGEVSKFMEANGLIPETQHGFRTKRSTLTAWAQIQLDWVNKEINIIQ